MISPGAPYLAAWRRVQVVGWSWCCGAPGAHLPWAAAPSVHLAFWRSCPGKREAACVRSWIQTPPLPLLAAQCCTPAHFCMQPRRTFFDVSPPFWITPRERDSAGSPRNTTQEIIIFPSVLYSTLIGGIKYFECTSCNLVYWKFWEWFLKPFFQHLGTSEAVGKSWKCLKIYIWASLTWELQQCDTANYRTQVSRCGTLRCSDW